MAWREPTSLGCAFEYARTVLIGWFPKDRRPGETYTGFIEFSLNHGPAILEIVQCRLRELLKRVAIRGRCWTVHGWVPIGGDGTRAPTPRTKRNLKGLGGLGRDRKNPQAWLTPLIHLPTGLLWSFIVDRGDSSERGHIKTMLGLLPKDSLFIADAGFVGYGLWRTMVESGQAFLIRAGSNVSLIKGLSREMKAGVRINLDAEIVWLWPKGEQGKKNPPLMLRLIVLHDGKKPVYLVTNVLDCEKLTTDHAREFYRMRWRVELWFRGLKQTMEREKLRSCAPEQAKLELSWMAVSLGVLRLLHVESLIEEGKPVRMATVAGALKVVREALSRPGGKRRFKARLLARLGQELKDDYKRRGPKQTRRYPKKKRYRCAGEPECRDATADERAQYNELIETGKAIAFTA